MNLRAVSKSSVEVLLTVIFFPSKLPAGCWDAYQVGMIKN